MDNIWKTGSFSNCFCRLLQSKIASNLYPSLPSRDPIINSLICPPYISYFLSFENLVLFEQNHVPSWYFSFLSSFFWLKTYWPCMKRAPFCHFWKWKGSLFQALIQLVKQSAIVIKHCNRSSQQKYEGGLGLLV